jgi:NADPH:quinone reductase-like Zn-dependent oxidoreductase
MSAKVTPGPEGGTMVAAYVTEWCAVGTVPDKISFGKMPAPPAPTKAEVLVGVKAASINVDDVPLLQNTGAGGWLYHTRKPSVKSPLVGGMDYAGVVLACGPDCTRLKVGDRVCGIIKVVEHQSGTWAEQTLAPERDVCLIEDASISFVDAAGVVMGAFVDFDMIKHAAKALAGGCRCLVLGASGALGTVMLQMLRKYKGHVTAVCRGVNAETVRRMGADEVVDYTKEPFGEQLAAAEKFAVVFDFVGGKEVQRSAEPLLEHGGLYITAVGNRQNVGDRELTCCEFTGSLCSILGSSLCGCLRKSKYVMSGAYPPMTAEIWQAAVIESGARAAIAEEVPFEEIPLREALRRVASHHPGGRVVINLERRG